MLIGEFLASNAEISLSKTPFYSIVYQSTLYLVLDATGLPRSITVLIGLRKGFAPACLLSVLYRSQAHIGIVSACLGVKLTAFHADY